MADLVDLQGFILIQIFIFFPPNPIFTFLNSIL